MQLRCYIEVFVWLTAHNKKNHKVRFPSTHDAIACFMLMLGLCVYREGLEYENYTIQTLDGINCVIYAAATFDLGPLLFLESQRPPYLIMAYESIKNIQTLEWSSFKATRITQTGNPNFPVFFGHLLQLRRCRILRGRYTVILGKHETCRHEIIEGWGWDPPSRDLSQLLLHRNQHLQKRKWNPTAAIVDFHCMKMVKSSTLEFIAIG